MSIHDWDSVIDNHHLTPHGDTDTLIPITYHRGEGTQEEGEGGEDTAGHIPPGTPRYQDEDDDTENRDEPRADPVLGLQEGLGALVDDAVDLLEAGGLFLVAAPREGLRLAAAAGRHDGDARDHGELQVRPQQAHRARGEDDCTGGLSIVSVKKKGERGQ